MKGILTTKTMPHLLFHGPAGTGKTSLILAFAKEMFGPKFYKKRVLELNASDDRGISVIRDKIKSFAGRIPTKNPDKFIFNFTWIIFPKEILNVQVIKLLY